MQTKKVFTLVISILFGLVTLYLYLLTSHTTTPIERWEEQALAYNLPDSPWYSIITTLIIITIFIIYKRFSKIKCKVKWDVSILLCIVYAIIGLALVYILKPKIIGEALKIFAVADMMHSGDFSWFEPYEYMYRYRYLTGMVMCVYDLVGIFGDTMRANLAMQAISVVTVAYSIWCIGRIVSIVFYEGENRIISVSINVFMYFLFFPLMCYSLNSYPIALSTALSVIAIYRFVRFVNELKLRHAVLSAIDLGMGVILKTNCKIVLIAMVCFTLVFLLADIVDYFKYRDSRYMTHCGLILTGIIIVFIGSVNLNKIPEKHCEYVIGHELSEGMPMTCWMAMGMQWGEAGPGTYNGKSVELYADAGYDKTLTNDLAIKFLKNTLIEYRHNPEELARFMGWKVSMEWGNPDYQASSVVLTSRKGMYFWMDLYKSLINGAWKVYLERICNIFMSTILLGSLLYILIDKDKNWNQMIMPITIIGGFIVFLIWETAPRYVLPYVILFFPFTYRGFEVTADRIMDVLNLKRSDFLIHRRHIIILTFCVVAVIIAYLCFHKSHLFNTIIRLRASDEQITYYYDEIVKNRLLKG